MEREDYYVEVLNEYPEYISLNQMYRICRISKRKGKFLLENGIIPCEDTKKKTRRFTIKTLDVVMYLKIVDENPDCFNIPHIFSSGYSNNSTSKKSKLKSKSNFNNYIQYRMKQYGYDNVEQFEIYALADKPDVMSIRQVANIFSSSLTTVERWVDNGKLKTINFKNRVYIPKEYLVDFVRNEMNTK